LFREALDGLVFATNDELQDDEVTTDVVLIFFWLTFFVTLLEDFGFGFLNKFVCELAIFVLDNLVLEFGGSLGINELYLLISFKLLETVSLLFSST